MDQICSFFALLSHVCLSVCNISLVVTHLRPSFEDQEPHWKGS